MLELRDLPDMPPGLREAAQQGRLVPFVGAGASRIAGCPGWGDFADGSLRALIDAGKLTYAQFDQIAHLPPRVKLSICRQLASQHSVDMKYKKILAPKGYADPKGLRLYGALGKLGNVSVTSNYDEWGDLDRSLPPLPLTSGSSSTPAVPPAPTSRNVFYKLAEFTAANLARPGSVFHLHGSVADPAGMIMTTHDYVQHYQNDRFTAKASGENMILTFLDHLFRHKTVLFVGYGLDELEILEYVILKARQQRQSGTAIRHYILQGYFSHELEWMRHMHQYYANECGIELIPFSRDAKDYDQLLDVLDNFAKALPPATLADVQLLSEMKDLLNG
jgi:hypothetical protein